MTFHHPSNCMNNFTLRSYRNVIVAVPFLIFGSLLISGCGKTTTEPGAPSRGVLTGTILDAFTSAPVSGATVSFFSGKNSAITGVDGKFEIDSLPIGKDAMTITKTGYNTLTDSVTIITDHLVNYSGFLNPLLKGWITSWQQVGSGTAVTLTNACYATKTTIYVCGFGGTVLRSTDGGATWNSVPTNFSGNYYCVHFSDAKTGFVMGNGGTIQRTTDAGLTWTGLNGNNKYNYRNISFSDALNGTAVGSGNSVAAAYRTTDGGASWTDQTGNLSIAPSPLYGVACASPAVGYIGGTDGSIFKTVDGGSSWVNVHSGSAWVRSISFTDPNTGTYVGAGGTISQTTDGGLTWNAQGSSPIVSLNGITNSDFRHATAVGENGTIMHTRTGGATWLNQSVNGFNGQFYGSAFADSIHGVIVGDNGAILIPVIQ